MENAYDGIARLHINMCATNLEKKRFGSGVLSEWENITISIQSPQISSSTIYFQLLAVLGTWNIDGINLWNDSAME
jgi:hypothetical protein